MENKLSISVVPFKLRDGIIKILYINGYRQDRGVFCIETFSDLLRKYNNKDSSTIKIHCDGIHEDRDDYDIAIYHLYKLLYKKAPELVREFNTKRTHFHEYRIYKKENEYIARVVDAIVQIVENDKELDKLIDKCTDLLVYPLNAEELVKNAISSI